MSPFGIHLCLRHDPWSLVNEPSKITWITAVFFLAFTCHEAHGAQCLAYSPSYQLLVSGGKRGDVSIFDLRQRKRLATSQAHDSHLKALALDPLEKFYVTGSTEGNIKVKISVEIHKEKSFSSCCRSGVYMAVNSFIVTMVNILVEVFYIHKSVVSTICI